MSTIMEPEQLIGKDFTLSGALDKYHIVSYNKSQDSFDISHPHISTGTVEMNVADIRNALSTGVLRFTDGDISIIFEEKSEEQPNFFNFDDL